MTPNVGTIDEGETIWKESVLV